MTMERFIFRSPMPAPAKAVLDWHCRPGAFERLSPPWETVRVLERKGGIEDGGRVVLAVRAGVSGAAGWPSIATMNRVVNSATSKPKARSRIGDTAIALRPTDRKAPSWKMTLSTLCRSGAWEVCSVDCSSAESLNGCFATVTGSQPVIFQSTKDIGETDP